MTTTELTPDAALLEYIEVFAQLKPEAIVPYYGAPCLFVTPQSVHPVPDAIALRARATPMMEQLRRQNYQRTDTLNLQTRMLAPNIAQCSAMCIRVDNHDGEISRFGITYTMRKDNSGRWKIVVAIVHDA